MTTVSLTLPADGQTIDASDVNTPFNAIAAVINGGIDSTNITDSGITPNELMTGTGTSWAMQSYTPTWTNLTSTSSTQTSKYVQIGKMVYVRFSIVFGASTSVSGDVSMSLPVTATAYPGTGNISPIGNYSVYDTSAGAIYHGWASFQSTTAAVLRLLKTDSTYAQVGVMSGTVPMTWATGDEIEGWLLYEAA